MTLPAERTAAVRRVELVIMELMPYVVRALRPSAAKRVTVPGPVLRNFYRALKHYPTGYDLTRTAEKCPELWGPPAGGNRVTVKEVRK